MAIFEHPSFDEHESVHSFYDPETGLKAFVAVHSTHLGPSAGGTRFWRYENSDLALRDVLRLSRGMSYKNAMAGLKLGGGKAVVMKPEGDFDRNALFTKFGEFINSIGGAYYTAEDVGMTTDDMRTIRTKTKFVAGLDEGDAASGDPSPITADGVFRCIKLAANKRGLDLAGATIAVQGLGHVGYTVCRLLHAVGAKLIVTDINRQAASNAADEFRAKIVAPDEIYAQTADVFSPCALGAILNPETVNLLKANIIAGAANNQLSTPEIGLALQDRDILYCPDYVVNAGGIINIAGEIEGNYSPEWVETKLQGIEKTLGQIFDLATETGRTTDAIADEMARARIGR
ncbi:MAG: amino acid dehydrogenase [Robiginitomaculum sp.]|nr:MAG: amino acid dehydrogenase [Robiginitomaculum sp.]